ncbi:thyroid transcription factor 1-associated protein 26 homolog [Anoplophora glabripennis]|uniref:thyroid transcription factor 1-associated protein 26 homolog n=1 Tax=Anoplophora glabripennis TaxID=217634 RepID=UPI000875A3E5|nr:thyroid transcription factor 1-associated protein 26 homolog [Anoplophora glabripennis]
MANNRVVKDRSHKTKDSFFKKSGKSFYKPKFQHKNKKEDNKETIGTESNNFFVKSNNPSTSNPKTSKVQDFQGENDSKTVKKPFDKKKYRLQKYSNKYQIQQWEDKRKKAVLRIYYKTLKEDQSNPTNLVHEDSTSKTDDVNKEGSSSNLHPVVTDVSPENFKGKRTKPFRKAHQEFQRIREEKERERELLLQRKKEKEEAMQKYKKKKIEKFKKLNKKTKKGQPIMKDRMEMLLEKIQNSITQEQ